VELKVRAVCRDMPGVFFEERVSGERVCRKQIRLGLQRGESIEGAVAADRDLVAFEPVFTVRRQPNGRPNFLGPYAKGPVAERFFYLVWAEQAADGSLVMFRRAKVPLGHLRWEDVEAAVREERPIEVELTLTDAKGGPKSGSFPFDDLHWSV
jgi:hypothetical protein